MGVHAAVLWGILTFMLSYIPYIGLIIAAIPAIFFAWLQFGIWGAVAVIALVCILNLVIEPGVLILCIEKIRNPCPARDTVRDILGLGAGDRRDGICSSDHAPDPYPCTMQ